MRLWKRRSQESKEEAPDAKERFARIIRTVELLCLEDLTVMQREMVYDFALWTLGQQIAADGYASFISGTTVREIRSLTAFLPSVKTDGECFEYRDPSGDCRTGKVPDYRFAAMYRIAQIKWEKGIRTEPPYASFGQTLDEIQKKEEKDTEELSIEQISQFYVDRCRDLRTRNYELTQEVQYLRQKQMPSQTSSSSK